MVRQWVAMGIFCVLRCLHCTLISALLAITIVAGAEWDRTSVELFPFKYEWSKFIFIPFALEVTRRRPNGTEVPKDGQGEICPVF